MEAVLRDSAIFMSHLFEAATLVLLALGALGAAKKLGLGLLRGRLDDQLARQIWMSFSRWVMVSLEFLLAADLVSTVVSPTWDELGRLATIAAIRTGLGYFLGRDLEAEREAEFRREMERRRLAGGESGASDESGRSGDEAAGAEKL
jgi:uncharacterized membrane protein